MPSQRAGQPAPAAGMRCSSPRPRSTFCRGGDGAAGAEADARSSTRPLCATGRMQQRLRLDIRPVPIAPRRASDPDRRVHPHRAEPGSGVRRTFASRALARPHGRAPAQRCASLRCLTLHDRRQSCRTMPIGQPRYDHRRRHAEAQEPRRERRLGRPPGRQGAQERGRRHDLYAVRRPHHRHLRRLHRRGHPHHRRAARAGRGARRRRLRAPDRQARLRGHHRRTRLHQCRDRYRDRVPLGKPDSAHRRPGRADAAQDGLAAGPAARRHDVARSPSSPPRCRAPSGSPT